MKSRLHNLQICYNQKPNSLFVRSVTAIEKATEEELLSTIDENCTSSSPRPTEPLKYGRDESDHDGWECVSNGSDYVVSNIMKKVNAILNRGTAMK